MFTRLSKLFGATLGKTESERIFSKTYLYARRRTADRTSSGLTNGRRLCRQHNTRRLTIFTYFYCRASLHFSPALLFFSHFRQPTNSNKDVFKSLSVDSPNYVSKALPNSKGHRSHASTNPTPISSCFLIERPTTLGIGRRNRECKIVYVYVKFKDSIEE